MTCNICAISNRKLLEAIENKLHTNKGTLSDYDKSELLEDFPEFAKEIKAIDEQSCYLHFNFHMQIARVPKLHTELAGSCVVPTNLSGGENGEKPAGESGAGASTSSISEPQKSGGRLVDEIRCDEAEILYEVLNMQAATFSALSNKINKALTMNDEEHDPKMMFIHPETRQFYNELGNSIRSTVKEIRETHKAINGEKDGALDGLKAIAAAIHGVAHTGEDDMTTKDFD